MNTTNLLLAVVLTLGSTFNSFAQTKTATISLTLPGHDHPEEVLVEIKDGFLIYEGDIIVGEEKQLQQKAATLLSNGRLWPNGTIPYVIPSNHPTAQTIQEAVEHVNNSTNLCLVERTDETDYVEFINNNSCASAIGKTGGRQTISASQYCGFGSYVHEILHAAGVFHEQSRHDRDEHIHIHWEEMNQSYRGNFNKYYSGQDIGEYDYESIMHYHEYAFSTTGQKTITLTDNAPEGTEIGQRQALSAGDIVGINTLYPQSSGCGTTNLSCDDSGEVIDMNEILQWDGITISNSGTQQTPPVMVDLYFSRNVVITTSDTYLGSVEIPTIEQGERYAFNEALDKASIEEMANGNSYYLGFIIDANDELAESNENDNNDCAASSNSISRPALPVQLIDFKADALANGTTELTWQVSEQYDLSHYLLQSSTDGKQWKAVARIAATNKSQQQYEYADQTKYRSDLLYYRLKMVDDDGSETLSETRSVRRNMDNQAGLTVFPNPSNGAFQINLPQQIDDDYLIKIVSLKGKIVHQQAASHQALQIDLQHLSAGTYWMNIITADEVMTQKLVLSKS